MLLAVRQEKNYCHVMRKPPLNALRMFDAAARHGNFRLAAEEVFVTQGAVAQQVRKLEDNLGLLLFTRLPRGLALTEAGALYHAEIRKALEIIDRATENLRPSPAAVVLSVPPSLATKWLVPRLADLALEHPEITLDLRASERLTDFTRDKVDLAVRQGRMRQRDGLIVTEFAPLEMLAVTRAVPSFRVHAMAIADFAGHRLIEDGHRHWTRLFEAAGHAAPDVALSFNQTALAIDAAVAGQGIALAPRLLVEDALGAGQLDVLWQVPARHEAYYLLHPDRPHPARDTVRDWLLGHM